MKDEGRRMNRSRNLLCFIRPPSSFILPIVQSSVAKPAAIAHVNAPSNAACAMGA